LKIDLILFDKQHPEVVIEEVYQQPILLAFKKLELKMMNIKHGKQILRLA
jgi:hypothetical protein